MSLAKLWSLLIGALGSTGVWLLVFHADPWMQVGNDPMDANAALVAAVATPFSFIVPVLLRHTKRIEPDALSVAGALSWVLLFVKAATSPKEVDSGANFWFVTLLIAVLPWAVLMVDLQRTARRQWP